MSEQKTYSTIEEAINDLLEGEQKENALKLISYLNENGLSPTLLPYKMDDGKTIGVKIPYNGHYLGWMLVKEKGEWMKKTKPYAQQYHPNFL